MSIKDYQALKPNLNKKVSVIMPVYNGEKYLTKAIDSIRNQEYTNWELIIINDGSADRTEQIINQYTDSRIKYYKNETNLGLIATLNKAIDLCQGEYIARMDADDISIENRLKEQVNFLDKNKDIGICGTDALIIDNEDKGRGNIINLSSNDYIQINLLFSVPIIHPSVMIRSSILQENKYDSNYKHIEDYELWCRISSKYKFSNLPKKLIKYRWHTNNVSVTYNHEQELLKNEIIKMQLLKLHLKPTEDELFLHRVSFMQYDAKNKTESKAFDKYEELESWFKKIISANLEIGIYNQTKLIAFLWSRWIVLCIKQKKYKKITQPRFAKYNVSVYTEVFKLMSILMKK